MGTYVLDMYCIVLCCTALDCRLLGHMVFGWNGMKRLPSSRWEMVQISRESILW